MGAAPDRRQPRHGQSGGRRPWRGPRLGRQTPLRLLLLGRRGSINHWLEDAAHAFRGDGHEVSLGIVRHPALYQRVRRAVVRPMAAEIARRAARMEPDLILAIGGFHVPLEVLEALREGPGGPPIVGWVGDAFGAEAAAMAALYDLVAHTDSGLEARHRELGFAAPTLWLPHAANPHRRVPRRERGNSMVFAAAASPERRRIVEAVTEPIAIFGPGWSKPPLVRHEVHGRRIPHRALAGLYAGHLASLNVRNAANVLTGLNQRNFDPYLFGAPVVSDAQPDLERCFELGVEALVYGDAGELNETYDRLRRERNIATRIASAGLRRILADHTFARRLGGMLEAL